MSVLNTQPDVVARITALAKFVSANHTEGPIRSISLDGTCGFQVRVGDADFPQLYYIDVMTPDEFIGVYDASLADQTFYIDDSSPRLTVPEVKAGLDVDTWQKLLSNLECNMPMTAQWVVDGYLITYY